MASAYPDRFVVVNGPEDGTEFPITQPAVFIGQDASCRVNVRLDPAVEPCHARVMAASDGYRVRSTSRARTYVDGKPVGTVRSRIVHPGGHVQVGDTLLVLECAPDGVVSRSRGIVSESDFLWALRQGGRSVLGLLLRCLMTGLRVADRLLAHWMLLLFTAAVVLFFFYAPFRQSMLSMLARVWFFFRSFLSLIPRTPGQS